MNPAVFLFCLPPFPWREFLPLKGFGSSQSTFSWPLVSLGEKVFSLSFLSRLISFVAPVLFLQRFPSLFLAFRSKKLVIWNFVLAQLTYSLPLASLRFNSLHSLLSFFSFFEVGAHLDCLRQVAVFL